MTPKVNIRNDENPQEKRSTEIRNREQISRSNIDLSPPLQTFNLKVSKNRVDGLNAKQAVFFGGLKSSP